MSRTPCRWLLSLLAVLLLISLVAAWPDGSGRPEIESLWRVEIIAHRGGLIERPDSTIAAFDHAVAAGADWLELDVHLSADGEVVVIHDDTVDRTTDGRGRVAELTLAQLRTLDAGYRWPDDMPRAKRRFAPDDMEPVWRARGLRILTLDEFLARYTQQRLMIEIKPAGDQVVEAVLDDIRRHDRERSVAIASFHQATLDAVRARAPDVATVASAGEARRFVILANLGLARFWRRDADLLAIPPVLGDRALVTPRVVRAARSVALPVYVWTINDEETWDWLVGLGVDGILTDRPEALNGHLTRRRLAPSVSPAPLAR